MEAHIFDPLAPGGRLLVFLKAPRPGTVKTRLAATLGSTAATAAYRTLVETLFTQINEWSGVELRYTPDSAADEIHRWQRPSWVLAPQGDGDLGQRMVRAFAEHFAAGAQKILIIGADCPDVTPTDLLSAWVALDRDDLVIGPANDGGYWLVGLRAPCPELFHGIAWSTDQVLAETLTKARAAGLAVARLRTLTDVDTEVEWRSWQARNPAAGI